jgi:hypothetical protein
MAAIKGVFIACFHDFREYLTTGEFGVVLVLARDRDQARIIFRYIRGILHAIPALHQMIVVERADEIELENGIIIAVKTSDYRTVRGVTVVCCICDEVAFWDNQGVNPDKEIFAALRPAMATIPNSKLIVISTGYARAGELYEIYKSYFGVENDEILVWQADTRTMNPTIRESLIQRELERDPQAARAEWLGLAREDVEAAFPLEAVEACVISGRVEFMPAAEITYFHFTDVCGARHDWWVHAVAHRSGEKAILDCIRVWKPPLDPSLVAKENAELIKLYRGAGTTGDNYAGEWPKAEFEKNGISYALSEMNESDLYLNLIPAICSKRVELLDNRTLVDQLRHLERRRGRSGKDTIDHPPRLHDDIANAVAGVVSLTLNGVADFQLIGVESETSVAFQIEHGDSPFSSDFQRGRFWDS